MTSRIIEHAPGRIVSMDGVLTQAECTRLIEAAESKGYKPSAASGGGHGQTPRTGARTSQFCVMEDDELSSLLWNRVESAVPDSLGQIKFVPYMNSQTRGDEYRPVSVSPHMRYYKYDPGQFVLKHDDYRMERFRYDPGTDMYYQQITFLTLLIYLNDDFQKGCTAFWTKYATTDVKGHCRFLRDAEFTEADLKITPQTGKGLISDHMVQHEGEAPEKGIKYVLRTDILHEKQIPKDRVTLKIPKGQLFSDWIRHFEPSCLHYTE